VVIYLLSYAHIFFFRLQQEEKVGVADFELLNLVGKGSFGKVIQVRKIDSGEIFAMKVIFILAPRYVWNIHFNSLRNYYNFIAFLAHLNNIPYNVLRYNKHNL
jgi:serine/threonine protein kinase